MKGPINIRLPEKIIKDIDNLSKKYGISRSEIIRQSLTFYLNMLNKIGNIVYPSIFRIMPSQIVLMKRGDISLMKFPTGLVLTLSFTSSGGIGSKILDKIKVEGFKLGSFMTRIVLMNTLAINSWPKLILTTLCVEMIPTGINIVEGVKFELKKIGLDPDQSLNVNSEENISTDQTGIGVIAVGFCHEDELRITRTQFNDALVVIGVPMVGKNVLSAEKEGKIATLQDVIKLSQLDFIHDIVPIDSNGVLYKARMIAQMIGRQVKFQHLTDINLNESAGPATAILITMNENNIEKLKSIFKKPVTIIGKIL